MKTVEVRFWWRVTADGQEAGRNGLVQVPAYLLRLQPDKQERAFRRRIDEWMAGDQCGLMTAEGATLTSGWERVDDEASGISQPNSVAPRCEDDLEQGEDYEE